MTDRKKSTAGFWITVALVAALAGYPLSFGPACWLGSRGMLPRWTHAPFRAFYLPLGWACESSPRVLDAYLWYTAYWGRKTPPP